MHIFVKYITKRFALVTKVNFIGLEEDWTGRLQYYLQQFWDRWSKDYLQTLQNRTKWTKGPVGDVVVVEEDNLSPQKWRLGRITGIHPGNDGLVRVITVKTSSGEIPRTSTKVRRLPVEGTESIQGGRDVQTKS
uniref:DUF5641 domain-containing protein n=1 Tax=Glossina austeni TaxID=7395 RepID=A0A1A9VDM6_GLOAU